MFLTAACTILCSMLRVILSLLLCLLLQMVLSACGQSMVPLPALPTDFNIHDRPLVAVDSYTGALVASCGTSSIVSYSNSYAIPIETGVCSDPCGDYVRGCTERIGAVSFNSLTGSMLVGCSMSVFSIGPDRVITKLMASALPSEACLEVQSLAVNLANGAVFAACYNGGGIVALEQGSHRTIASNQQCLSPVAVIVDSTTGTIYAGCSPGNSVTTTSIIAISNVTGLVSTVMLSGQCWSPEGFDLVDGVLYAACNSYNGIISLDLTTGLYTVLATNAQCPRAVAVVVHRLTGDVYAACSNGVTFINRASSAVTTVTTSACGVATDVSINEASGQVFAGCSGNTLQVVSVVSVLG